MQRKPINKTVGISTLIAKRLSRRQALQYGLGSILSVTLPMSAFSQENNKVEMIRERSVLLGFKSIPIANLLDEVVVAEGYHAEVFYRWGDPVSDGPDFNMDGSNSAEEQLKQAGMHHDAIQFYPLPAGSKNSEHGLLVMNHEYIDPQILHSDGGIADKPEQYTAEKMLKEQNAHGVSVIEVAKRAGNWQVIRPSAYARRLTATTAIAVSGPASGDDQLKTGADPQAKEISGTLNNCANGKTPWGTYLSCEENFNVYFDLAEERPASAKQKLARARYQIESNVYGWHKHDDRFNVTLEPNEMNRFGWVVEFDPYDPASKPVKRTALGRFSHENVAYNIGQDGRIAFFSGDDSEFEYVYKFITNSSWDGSQGAHHGALLDDGVLYVARFDEKGNGHWLPLIFGKGTLTAANGFENQADVLIHARLAADAVGATPMDRPEWVATDPNSQGIYISMTKNSKRGKKAKPEKDMANPRNVNKFGHIIKILEDDATSTIFNWDVFALAGDLENGGSIEGDQYANPDGLMIDDRGVLWVQTDVSSSKLNSAEFTQFGNNQMLAIDQITGETRRFLTGPIGCEVTGVTLTPDLKTMWVNIQHPGDVPEALKQKGIDKSPQKPNAASNWPDHELNGRPRSATVLITKNDGGVIGS